MPDAVLLEAAPTIPIGDLALYQLRGESSCPLAASSGGSTTHPFCWEYTAGGYLRGVFGWVSPAVLKYGNVLIHGHRAPVVGRVSMNTIMVDFSQIEGVRPGDAVVLFGRQGSDAITPTELAEMNGALLADIYPVLGPANPRVLKPNCPSPEGKILVLLTPNWAG